MLPPTLPRPDSGSDGEIIDEGGAEIKYSRDPITGNNDIYSLISPPQKSQINDAVLKKSEGSL